MLNLLGVVSKAVGNCVFLLYFLLKYIFCNRQEFFSTSFSLAQKATSRSCSVFIAYGERYTKRLLFSLQTLNTLAEKREQRLSPNKIFTPGLFNRWGTADELNFSAKFNSGSLLI